MGRSLSARPGSCRGRDGSACRRRESPEAARRAVKTICGAPQGEPQVVQTQVAQMQVAQPQISFSPSSLIAGNSEAACRRPSS